MHTADTRAAAALACEVVEDLREIDALAAEWDALLERTPCNRAFSSHAWYAAACRVNPSLKPHLITARRGPSLAALFPLAVDAAAHEAVFPSAMSNYNDIVAEADDSEAATALLRHALTHPRAYGRLSLWWIRKSSNAARAARLLFEAGEAEEAFGVAREYAYLRLPGSYEEFLKGRSRAFRKALLRAQRKAAADGLRVRELTPEEFPPSELPEMFLRLHLARFGERSCFEKQANLTFARLALPPLFARRQMRVFALLRGEEVVGIDLSMNGASSLCTWNGGFLPEFEQWSPGRLVIDAGVRRACELGLGEYDLLRGAYDWKMTWADSVREVGRLEFTLRG
ncbi:MAG: GNAT family N-acetyltransferase [Acidobacteria bacterium]|nr:GNAT family N-acetyltransferase [Acidobacteriota bacterium]